MDIITYVLIGISIILGVINLINANKSKQHTELLPKDKEEILKGFESGIGIVTKTVSETQKMANDALVNSVNAFQKGLENNLTNREEALEKTVKLLSGQLVDKVSEMSRIQKEKLEEVRSNTENQIKSMREENNKQLEQMRQTVDEKLTKTLNERFNQSFEMLSKQLESVYKSIGEMQTMATEVGNLSKVLSNVKTTGIFGEIQLGALLEQILIKEQYDVNVITADKHDPVEFAIKLPGQVEGEYVYLPVDSKFPLTLYTELYNAYESNNFDLVKQKKDALKSRIKAMAKDIQTKYIYPPKTTNFAIMFLPIEGLYAEVAKMGLIEELQRAYNITIAGPTTMGALLNSLQMGFNTLAIQKKSGEVWKILGAVKTEFDKFNTIIEKIQANFEKTSKEFDTLVGTRSRLIVSKLRNVEKLNIDESKQILGAETLIEGNGEDLL